MKLVSRVSSEVIAIKGSARLTDFRIESLKERFQQLTHLDLTELNCNEIYFLELDDQKKIENHDSLKELGEILAAEKSYDFQENK